ncbi:glycosyltransferase family 2 protein [Hymenobacter sp. HD11105]
MDVLLSIAIVTCNRPVNLRNTLSSLSSQTAKPFEIIISDDSNTEATISANKLLAEQYNCKYYPGPQKGLYSNRNYAAKRCLGSHIRTMDDDHTFPQSHIEECLLAINSDPDVIWVIGEYYPIDNDIPGNEKWRVNKDGNILGLPHSIPGQLHPKGYAYTPMVMDNYYGISCGATIYPKAVFDKGFFYSEAYRFGILYLEYGIKLFKNGFKIKHLNTTYIVHHCVSNDPSVTSKEISDGAKIFSILMFSFHYNQSFSNKVLTLFEICKGFLKGDYSIKLLRKAYKNFLIESKGVLASKSEEK